MGTCRRLSLAAIRLRVVVGGGPIELVAHVGYCQAWRQDFHPRTVTHEDGIHLVVDDDLDLEDTTAVVGILADEMLRGVHRLGLDVVALIVVGPELDAARKRTSQVLAHPNHVVKEVLSVKVRILAESDILGGRDTHDAVQRQVEQLHLVVGAAEQEPAVAELLEQIGVQHILYRVLSFKGLVDDAQHAVMGNVVIEGLSNFRPLRSGTLS